MVVVIGLVRIQPPSIHGSLSTFASGACARQQVKSSRVPSQDHSTKLPGRWPRKRGWELGQHIMVYITQDEEGRVWFSLMLACASVAALGGSLYCFVECVSLALRKSLARKRQRQRSLAGLSGNLAHHFMILEKHQCR